MMILVPRPVPSNCLECVLNLRIGFMRAVQLVLRVKESGLVAGGPPCSSWISINYPTHRRTIDNTFGDSSRSYVKANTKFLF